MLMGGLIPLKIQDYKGWSPKVPDDSSFLFFYEDDNFRLCKQQNGLSQMSSKAEGSIIGLGASGTGQAFIFSISEGQSAAKLNRTRYGFSLPYETNLAQNGDNLYFGGFRNSPNFTTELIEIFGL